MRFDLPPPRGTCYLAEEPIGAFVEAFQDWTGSIIPLEEVSARRISTLEVPNGMNLADCSNPRALAFGVTAEIHSSPMRALTQDWATAFASAGFAGIRFLVRHDPGQRRVGIALFGVAGQGNWHVRATHMISSTLVSEVEASFGIRVR